MKSTIKIAFLLFITVIGTSVSAQKVTVNSVHYEIVKDEIFKNGIKITDSLSPEERSNIMTALKEKQLQLEVEEETQKRLERAEKEQQKAIKRQKQAEKALKRKQKAQSNFDKATKRHNVANKKYLKLKKKGKLSPEDEAKWLEKIEKLNTNLAKAQRKLKKS